MSAQTIIGNNNIKFGTVLLAGTVYGQVESGSIKHLGDEEGVPDQDGGFQAYAISNLRYEIEFTAIFPASAAKPVIGDRVDIAEIGLAASLLSWSLVYEKGKSRKIQVTCAHWTSIGGATGAGPTVTVINNAASPPPSED